MAVLNTLQDLFYGQLETVDNPNPRLAAQLEEDALTIALTAPVAYSDGTIVNDRPFILSIRDLQTKKPEMIYVQAGELSLDGKTITLAGLTQRGLEYDVETTLDFFSGDAARRVTHVVDSPVRNSIAPQTQDMIAKGLLGDLAVTVKHETRPLYDTNAAGANPVFADATARDAALAAPQAGDRCRVTTLGSQEYDGVGWVTFGVVTPTTASLGVKKVAQDFQADLLVSGGLVLSANSIQTDKASKAEAEGGTENTKVMSALRVKEAIDFNAVPVATASSFTKTDSSLFNQMGNGILNGTFDYNLGETFNYFKIDFQIMIDINANVGTPSGDSIRFVVDSTSLDDVYGIKGAITNQLFSTDIVFPYQQSSVTPTQDISISSAGGSFTITSFDINGTNVRFNWSLNISAGGPDNVAKIRVFNAYATN